MTFENLFDLGFHEGSLDENPSKGKTESSCITYTSISVKLNVLKYFFELLGLN